MSVNEPVVNPGTIGLLEELVEASFRVRRAVGRRANLSELEMGTLQLLIATPSSPSELARDLQVSTAASTGLVDRLEQRGHLERRAHPTDRRRTEVHVTASGRLEMDRHIQPLTDALAEVDDEIGPEDRVVIETFLRRAIAAFDRVSQDDS
jgi:DNA-binding MarR family transcriptional regulator